MTEAGGEDGEEDGEHHDGEANHHATNTTFPGMRQHCLLEKEVVSYGDFLNINLVVEGRPQLLHTAYLLFQKLQFQFFNVRDAFPLKELQHLL